MFAWLVQLPHWFQITFTIIILLTFLYVIITAIAPLIRKIIRDGFLFKDGDKTVSFGNKGQDHDCSHELKPTCPFRKDLLIFFNESSKLFNEKNTILFVTQIKDQMNYAEQKIDQIRMKLHSIYLAELKRIEVPSIVQNKSFISYKYLLKDIQEDILSKLRYFFRENHFDELSESDFTNYINGKFDYLVSEFSDALNDIYYDDEYIKREYLYEINMEYTLDIKPYIVDIFQHARSVAIDYKVKLLEIDEKLENLVKRFLK